MNSHRSSLRHSTALLMALAAAGMALVAQADSGPRLALTPAYQQECGGCHTPFPPGMLPTASWQRLMADLPHHYGTDASLDPKLAASLSAWLGEHAGTFKRVGNTAPPQDRITLSQGFMREHREIAASTWALPAVKSATNCSACHPQADKGNFNEHDIRIPR